MPYLCELGSGQMLYLKQNGAQTSITLASIQPGHQQQSSSSFSTGMWTAPPEVFSTPLNVVVRLHTDKGDRHLQIQGGSIRSIHNSPAVRDSQKLQAQFIDHEPDFVTSSMQMNDMDMGNMEGMGNMGDMHMGNMQMSMKPMEMRMGDMELRMDNSSSSRADSTSRTASASESQMRPNTESQHQATESAQSTHSRRFCSQCGAPITPSDRFCASCGTRLDRPS